MKVYLIQSLYEDYKLSANPADLVTFGKKFPGNCFCPGNDFKSKRSRIFHYFTMNVDPGNNYVENFHGGIVR